MSFRFFLTKIINYLMVCVLIAASIPLIANAEYDEEFFAGNDILFYNPDDTDTISSGCISNSFSNKISQESKEKQAIIAKYLTSTNFIGNNNKPMNAVQMAAIAGNIQWESRSDPNSVNKKSGVRGIVQWNSERWGGIIEPKTNLDNQLNYIKTELDSNYYKLEVGDFWSMSNASDLDEATYLIARNYEVAIKNGGGLKSWTNDSDATNNLQDWSKRKADAIDAYNDFGNLATYGYKPGPDCGGQVSEDGTITPGNGKLISGGMTLKEAQSFMNEYKNSGTKPEYGVHNAFCPGGPLANCVAFSQYFINRYTEKWFTKTGNGADVVKNLIKIDFKNGGHTPKVYAVFSTNYPDPWGHTGVILAIDTEKNTAITGEAGCGEKYGFNWIGPKTTHKLSDLSNGSYTYAYTDEFLKDDSL